MLKFGIFRIRPRAGKLCARHCQYYFGKLFNNIIGQTYFGDLSISFVSLFEWRGVCGGGGEVYFNATDVNKTLILHTPE